LREAGTPCAAMLCPPLCMTTISACSEPVTRGATAMMGKTVRALAPWDYPRPPSAMASRRAAKLRGTAVTSPD